MPVAQETIAERVRRIDLPFNRYGLDPFGVSRAELARAYRIGSWFYRHYFRVQTFGIEHIPKEGAALLIGNHSGGLPLDASLVFTSLFMEMEPPRYVHAMVEYFAQKFPFVSEFFSRLGQFTGLPEHCERLLSAGRLVMVFPEGARGTGKLYKDRYNLVRFGTGFMRLAMSHGVPIIPFGFVGGEEAIPTVLHLRRLAKWVGVPYIPVPVQILPMPLPVACQIYFGEPLVFEGDGTEPDDVVEANVEVVKARIRELLDTGLSARTRPFDFGG